MARICDRLWQHTPGGITPICWTKLEHIHQFLIELGAGFSYIGQQYRLEVGGEDFYIDLLKTPQTRNNGRLNSAGLPINHADGEFPPSWRRA
jgi:hypothetical protein